jgi:hypothetical protein
MTDEEFQNRILSFLELPLLEDYKDAVFELMKVATREQRAKAWEVLRNKSASQRLTPEQRISRALRSALEHMVDGAEFLGTRELRRACDALEYFLPSVLAEVYPYWKKESLDGFYFSEARKLGPQQAELFGMCILISDQTLTPIHLQLKVAPAEEKIDGMECKLGKRGTGEGEMERVPWSQWRDNPFAGLPDSKELVDWVYRVTVQSR